jgi:hypothetical protein
MTTNDRYPILWLDDFEKADTFLALQPMPVLIFSYFWPKNRRRNLDGWLEKWNTQAYFFEPFEVDIDVEQGLVESIYKTDCFEVTIKETYDDADVLSKLSGLKGIKPSYLWNKTFLQKDYDLKILSEKTEFTNNV